MPILIGPDCATAWRRNAGAAISAEPASVASSTLRRVTALTRYFCFVVIMSSLMVSCYDLLELDGVELCRQDELEQLAVVRIVEHGVLDLRRLQPGGAL